MTRNLFEPKLTFQLLVPYFWSRIWIHLCEPEWNLLGNTWRTRPTSSLHFHWLHVPENLKFPCGIIILFPSSNSTWLFMRINLQLQTSDFVDVDLASDHSHGSSKSKKKNHFWHATILYWAIIQRMWKEENINTPLLWPGLMRASPWLVRNHLE